LKKFLHILVLLTFQLTAFGQAFLSNNGGLISVKHGAMLSARGDVINSNGGEFHNSDTIYCNKHWINNAGNEAFTSSGEGIVIFYGALQRITGSDITRFYDLRHTGSDIKYGELDVYVDGFLRLSDREFNLDINTVHVFSDNVNAVSQQGGFVSSLQSGGLLRNTASTQPYSFPVGSSLGVTRFRPIDLTLSSANPNTFKVRMANVDATTESYDRAVRDADVCEVNPQFYHRIYREQGTDSTIVAVHYDPAADGIWDSLVHWQNVPQWEITGAITQGPNPAYNLTAITSTNYIDDFTHPAFALAQVADSINLTYSSFCDGDTTTLTADAGYSNYDFYVNGVLVQSGPSNTYTGVLNQGDIVQVIVDANSFCSAASRQIIVQTHTNSISLTVNDLDICDGDSQTYTATPGFLNYDFYVNGVLVQSGPGNTYTVIGLSDGDDVYVIGTDAVCGFESNHLQVTVFSGQVDLTTDPPYFCDNQSVAFIASTGFLNYDFYLNGTLVQSSNSNTYTPTTIQNGDSIYVVASDVNCQYTSPAVYVQLTGQSLQLTASTLQVCSGGAPIDFTADPGFDNYDFLVNGVSVQNGTLNTYTAQLNNQDSIWVVATIDSCQYTSNVLTITVFPDAQVDLTTDPPYFCDNQSVTFIASTGFLNYDFYLNSTLQQSSNSNTYTPTTIQNGDSIYVVVTDANCPHTSAVVYIQFSSQTLQLMASTLQVCSGAPIDFTADPGFDNYDFLVNGVSVQNGTSNTYTGQLNNQDSIWAIATIDSCQYTSNVLTVTIFPGASANAYSDTTIVEGESVQIFATGGVFYDWVPGGTLSCDDCPDPIATPDSTTVYWVTVENMNGCTAADSVLVTVLPPQEDNVNIPNAFSPNGDSKNDTWHISYLNAYPDNEVVVLNRWGDQLFYAKPYVDEFDGTFQGKPLPRGTYYFILKVNVNNEIKVFKGPLTIVR